MGPFNTEFHNNRVDNLIFRHAVRSIVKKEIHPFFPITPVVFKALFYAEHDQLSKLGPNSACKNWYILAMDLFNSTKWVNIKILLRYIPNKNKMEIRYLNQIRNEKYISMSLKKDNLPTDYYRQQTIHDLFMINNYNELLQMPKVRFHLGDFNLPKKTYADICQTGMNPIANSDMMEKNCPIKELVVQLTKEINPVNKMIILRDIYLTKPCQEYSKMLCYCENIVWQSDRKKIGNDVIIGQHSSTNLIFELLENPDLLGKCKI